MTRRKVKPSAFSCIYCEGNIPQARVDAGYHRTCVNCSDEVRHVGLMDYEHKTAGQAQIIRGGQGVDSTEHAEQVRRARAVYNRERHRS